MLSFDLERTLSEIQLHDQDLHKIRQLERQQHQNDLTAREVASAKAHDAALEAAQKYRDSVRFQAENVLHRHMQLEAEARRKALEVEQQRQRELEAAEAEKARKIKENAARLDRLERERREREAREEAEKAENAEKEAQARQREEERKSQEAAERRKKEADDKAEQDAAAEKQRQTAETAQRARQQQSVTSSSTASSAEQIHQEYLVLYDKLKKFKNDFADEVKAYPKAEKEPVGDGRRLIKSSVGKLSYGEARANSVVTEQIKQCILSAFSSTSRIARPVAVNNLLPAALNLHDNDQQTIPAFAVYLLTLLAQHVCKIFTSYVHGEPQRAEPIGICMIAIFGWDKLQFQRMNPKTRQVEKIGLFSILLAKYHKMCPALFGITGDQSTTTGRRRLGWQLIHGPDTAAVAATTTKTKTNQPTPSSQPASYEASRRKPVPTIDTSESRPKNTFCLENIHYDRTKGLAIGYSALALRNVSNSKTLVNPYPPRNFWLSLVQIINMPTHQVQPTHMCVLRYMFGHNGVGRFLLFFGAVGVAVLRQAFVEFPTSLPPPLTNDSFTKECMVYVENDLAGKMHFHFD